MVKGMLSTGLSRLVLQALMFVVQKVLNIFLKNLPYIWKHFEKPDYLSMYIDSHWLTPDYLSMYIDSH